MACTFLGGAFRAGVFFTTFFLADLDFFAIRIYPMFFDSFRKSLMRFAVSNNLGLPISLERQRTGLIAAINRLPSYRPSSSSPPECLKTCLDAVHRGPSRRRYRPIGAGK